MWFAATVIQARQRRNEWRGYYLLALRAATVFVALYRMWPVRRRYVKMRNAAITIESSIHMCLVRWPYLRLRVANGLAQKIVRGSAHSLVGRTIFDLVSEVRAAPITA